MKFGTDGVRGQVNSSLKLEDVLSLGQVHAYWLRQKHRGSKRPQVVVGRDSRVSGDALLGAYGAGLMSQGVDLVDVGVLPTPAVAVAVRSLAAGGGVMLSASHNPVPDNGIKIFDQRGEKLTDEQARELEALWDGHGALPLPSGVALGRRSVKNDFVPEYLDFLQRVSGVDLSSLKVVLDCAYGAASGIARQAFERAGAQVVALHDQPDGERINVSCGSTDLRILSEAVKKEGAQLGLAFDGDADRCLAVTEKGEAITGDQMMVLIAEKLHREKRLPNALVVLTVMSNLGAEQALNNLGVKVLRTAVGDRYVFESMRKHSAVLGGEQSGHILFLDRHWSGDGILSGLVFCGVLAAQPERQASELVDSIPEYPQKLVNVSGVDRDSLDRCGPVQEAISRAQDRLGENGRLLVRASGTEPLIRLMAEGKDLGEVEAVLEELKGVVLRELSLSPEGVVVPNP